MKRQPSLHITVQELANQLKTLGVKAPLKIAKEIAKNTKKDTLNHRKQLIVNSTLKKKIAKNLESNAHYAEKFNGLLTSIRLKHRMEGGSRKSHTGIKPIKKDSKQYSTLLKVTENAIAFSDAFELPYLKGGFRAYIDIGMGFMRTYRINTFITLDDRISRYKDILLELKEDTNSLTTEQFYYRWIERLEKETGIVVPFINDKEKYVHIMRAKLMADQYNCDYVDWIEAQFAGLTFINNIPELSQLYTENSALRYQKYLYILKLNKDGKTKMESAFETTDEANWYYNKYLKKNDTTDRK